MKRLWVILPLLFIFSCEDNTKEKEEEINLYPSGKIRVNYPISRETLISVDASDDVGIERVDFFVNDLKRKIDKTEPYEFIWNSVKDLEGTHTIKATIYNVNGNSISDEVQASVEITNVLVPQDFKTIANDSIKEVLDEGDTISVYEGTYFVKNLNIQL